MAGDENEWVRVPRVPTPKMIRASNEISCRDEGREHWDAMLAAAPAPEDGREEAKDAARYRWLRGPYDSFKPYIRRDTSAGFEILLGANADEAIDAAIAQAERQGESE